MEHAPRPGRETQRFAGPTQAAQAVDGACVGACGVASLVQAAVQAASLGIVLERGLMLAEQAMGIAADLTRRGLLFLVAVGIGDGDRVVRRAKRLSGAAY